MNNQETVLVTGAAGFIGYHTIEALLDNGKKVIGLDNLNDYYSVELKKARLAALVKRDGFSFFELDIADHETLLSASWIGEIDCIVHLAAQAGVRHSLENPFAYASSNLTGHLAILELARRAQKSLGLFTLHQALYMARIRKSHFLNKIRLNILFLCMQRQKDQMSCSANLIQFCMI